MCSYFGFVSCQLIIIQLYRSTLTWYDYHILSKKKFNLKITDFSTNMIDLNYEKQNKMSNCITNNHSKLKHILMWEPKMCRLAWQLLGMLGNVLGLLDMLHNVLGMLCNVLGMLATSSASSACYPQGPRSPTSKIKPPTCFLISCEAKRVVYHQASNIWELGGTLLPWLHSL